MFARLLALLCLLNLGVPLSSADSSSQAVELVVYLRTGAKQAAGPTEAMKRELPLLMQSVGYRVEWLDARAGTPVDASETLIVVELHGACGIPSGQYTAEPVLPDDLNSLASTAVSDGRVLPFATVNCANLNRTLGAVLAPEAGARRDFLYGRALARVLAHEFYHILIGTAGHTGDGVSKPCFTQTELLTEQFGFQAAVVSRFRQAQAEPDFSRGFAGETPATGR